MCSLIFEGEVALVSEDLVVRGVMAGYISKCHYFGKTNLESFQQTLAAACLFRDIRVIERWRGEWIAGLEKTRAGAALGSGLLRWFTDRTVD